MIWTALYAAILPTLMGVFLFAGVHRYFHGNASALFYFGEQFAAGAALPEEAWVGAGSGYDGQFYYRIALDPFLPLRRAWQDGASNQVAGVDAPAYRYRRIAYPTAARLATLGDEDALVWAFPAVAVLSVWMGCYCACRLFEASGWAAYWGASYALLPGVVFSLARNLCDAFAGSMIMVSMLAIRRDRMFTAACALTVAHLTHETSALVSVGLLLHFWRQRQPARVFLFALPLIVVLAWFAIVSLGFARPLDSTMASGGGALGIPLKGIGRKLLWLIARDSLSVPSAFYAALPWTLRARMLEALLILPISIGAVLLVGSSTARTSETWLAGLFYVALIAVCTDLIWEDTASYTRVTLVPLSLALYGVARGGNHRIGYTFLASVPPAGVAAIVACVDNWNGWRRIVF